MENIMTLLVCPDCRKKLVLRDGKYGCPRCKRSFHQSEGHIEMLPIGFDDNRWVGDEMDFWKNEHF